MNLKIKRLTQTAKLPKKNNLTDAGFDLFTDEAITIHNGETVAVSTGVALEIPEGYYGRLKSRSGLTLKSKLRVLEGTIDSDFRGEVKILAELKGFEYFPERNDIIKSPVSSPLVIPKGMKIAQLIIQPLPDISIVEVDELDETDRGANGFGSSGV